MDGTERADDEDEVLDLRDEPIDLDDEEPAEDPGPVRRRDPHGGLVWD